MKYLIPTFILICFFLIGCEKNSNDGMPTTIDSLAVPKDTCISRTYGTYNINYCLDSIEDSRCPSNAVCVWQGVATANMKIKINQISYPIKLYTLNNINVYSNDTTIAGFNIKLVDVTPYPSLPPSSSVPKAIIKVIKL